MSTAQDVLLILKEKDRLGYQRNGEALQASIVHEGMTGEQSTYGIEDSGVFCRINLKEPSSGKTCRIGKSSIPIAGDSQEQSCLEVFSLMTHNLSPHLVSTLVTHLVGFDSRILGNDACSTTRSIKQDTVKTSKHLQADVHLELHS